MKLQTLAQTLLFCIAGFVTALPAMGKDSEPPLAMINVDHRETTSLAGTWEVIIDPFQRGFLTNDLTERKVDSQFAAAATPKDKSDKLEYGFENGEQLAVPGDWNTQDDRLFFYEGMVWYKKNFDYTLEPGKRLFVYFGAANYRTIVYLNGVELGRHEGGFTPFSFEITDLVKPEGNTLVVNVDNTRTPTGIPTMMSDWWNYGGITRRVLLVEEPATFIRDFKVQLEKNSMSRIAGWVQLDGKESVQPVTLSIPGAGIETTVQTDAKGYATFAVDAELDLWSPENPKLYTVELKAKTDEIEDRIGFRSIQVKGTEILLNGKSIFLRGISIHEEAPFRTGRAHSREDALILLGWAKELGCNFVRLAHYPHNEFMVRAADELGLLVWSEIPLYWAISWEDPIVRKNAWQQITEMITRDKNRASIILWSVANETRLSDARNKFLGELADYARELDPTRLITAALLADKGYVDGRGDNVEEKIQVSNINDPLGKHLDVIGCNEYIGWYGSFDPSVWETVWKTPYDKPLVMSEFGGGARQGFHADKDTVFSEEFLVNVYEQQFAMLDKIPFLRGVSPWILVDFRSPRRLLPRVQDYFNRKGLISDKGDRKDAFFTVQKEYERLKKEK